MPNKEYYEDDTPRNVDKYLQMSHEERLSEIERIEREHTDRKRLAKE